MNNTEQAAKMGRPAAKQQNIRYNNAVDGAITTFGQSSDGRDEGWRSRYPKPIGLCGIEPKYGGLAIISTTPFIDDGARPEVGWARAPEAPQPTSRLAFPIVKL